MSYDLAVFQADGAPREPEQFMDWFYALREVAEESETSLPSPANANFAGFYEDMVRDFPDMNGPSGENRDEGEDLTGYEFQPDHIYMDFRWSASERAVNTVIILAKKHGLGLYDLNDGIIFPEDAPNDSTSEMRPRSIKDWLGGLFRR